LPYEDEKCALAEWYALPGIRLGYHICTVGTRQNIVFVCATRMILLLHNVSGIAVNTLLVLTYR